MDQFNGIHKAIDKVRSTSKTVTVDTDALAKLLIEHSKLLLRATPERHGPPEVLSLGVCDPIH
jgi:hypothetical protein